MYITGSFLVLLAGLLSSTWAIPHLQNNEYRDILSNPPVYVEDTTPTFFTKKQAAARVVLVLDYTVSMSSYNRMDHLKIAAVRWIIQLKSGTQVAVVRFAQDAIVVKDWVDVQDDTNLLELINAINGIVPDGSATCMACGLKKAGELMTDPNAPGHAGVVLVFTDGYSNVGPDVGDISVWRIFKRNSIRVLPVLLGIPKDTDIETLARETKGKVFVANYDGSDLDDIFDWVSQTYIPPELADPYEWSELSILQRDWFTADFGPPGRISDLSAGKVGDEGSRIVELKWTGAGDDLTYGPPASYNVHYSTKRSNLYTKNLKMSSQVTSKILTAGSLEPVPIGQKMGITVSIPNLEVAGTYHFAVRAVDTHGQESKASNIVTVNFHDRSPVVRDVSPLHTHGIQTSEAPLIEKLRKRYKDERIVQGYLKKAAKIKQMVWEAENSVMEKRLSKTFGDNEKVLAKTVNTIKTNPEKRNLYKKILL